MIKEHGHKSQTRKEIVGRERDSLCQQGEQNQWKKLVKHKDSWKDKQTGRRTSNSVSTLSYVCSAGGEWGHSMYDSRSLLIPCYSFLVKDTTYVCWSLRGGCMQKCTWGMCVCKMGLSSASSRQGSAAQRGALSGANPGLCTQWEVP